LPPDILIRAARVADAEAFCLIRGLPGVRRGTLALPFPTVEASRKRLEAISATDTFVVAEAAGAVVGAASLHRKLNRLSHCASVGIMVHDDHQGRGVGTALMAALTDAADKWLGVLRLELEVNVDNVAALALYRRFGFVVEGRSVASTFRDGEYVDCFTMARLAGVLAGRHAEPGAGEC
jgi:putative acetyltransferase